MALLEEEVDAAGLVITPEGAQAAAAHAVRLVEANRAVNLTRLTEPRTIVRRHFVEAFVAATLVPASAGTLLDVGSGGGFPGLAVKAVRPDLQVTLLEPVQRKAAFLRLAATCYQGRPTRVLRERVEGLRGTETWDVVTTRGVRASPAHLAAPCHREGRVILFTARDPCVEAAELASWARESWREVARRPLGEGRSVVALVA